jgi:hypothetical protein
VLASEAEQPDLFVQEDFCVLWAIARENKSRFPGEKIVEQAFGETPVDHAALCFDFACVLDCAQ